MPRKKKSQPDNPITRYRKSQKRDPDLVYNSFWGESKPKKIKKSWADI